MTVKEELKAYIDSLPDDTESAVIMHWRDDEYKHGTLTQFGSLMTEDYSVLSKHICSLPSQSTMTMKRSKP